MTAAQPRRAQLLDAAAGLFAERGFHAVGVDDIGAAAGISGPGVYRHFSSKQALLEALVDDAMTQMLTGAEQIYAAQPDLAAALDELSVMHVRFSVEQRALIGVWVRETRALSEAVHLQLGRQMRAYEDVWVRVLQGLRPELEPRETVLRVSAALAMLNGTAIAHSPTSGSTRNLDVLRQMVHAALLC